MDHVVVYEHVRNCLRLFKRVIAVSSISLQSEDYTPSRTVNVNLREEEARFKVWVGNTGAHQCGFGSLHNRLGDAPRLIEYVNELLVELIGLLENARTIMLGEKIPWENLEGDDGPTIDGIDFEMAWEDIDPKTELDQTVMDVADVVNCLLRFSAAIRNPAPHDRFAAIVPVLDTNCYEPFDINHVHEKFGQAEQWLTVCLGKAISRRRQYFKYREQHRQKLARGLELDHDALSHELLDGVSTIASSIPTEAKRTEFDLHRLSVLDEDALSDSGVSQTSFASSLADSEQLMFPRMPNEAYKGPFECPFCFQIISVSTTINWRRHVFADLRPYICLWKDCSDIGRTFARRREWAAHELRNHWKRYFCPYGCGDIFLCSSNCKEHLEKVHPNTIPPNQIEVIISLSSRPAEPEDDTQCPLCQEALSSFKQYQRHVGRHQEQLAMFALPQRDLMDEGDSEADDSEESNHAGRPPHDYIRPSGFEDSEISDTLTKGHPEFEFDRLWAWQRNPDFSSTHSGDEGLTEQQSSPGPEGEDEETYKSTFNNSRPESAV